MSKRFLLQLFADGGDGGDGGSTAPAGDSANNPGEEIPSSIPERAKKFYKQAIEKTQPARQQTTDAVTTESPSKLSYEEMIKSDDYKDAHKAYMDKTIGDRLKKYKGIESDYGRARDMLNVVAQKYGVDPTAEDFMDALGKKIEADDSYYEDYAMEHDISTEDARKMVTMERKLKAIEAEREMANQQEAQRQQILQLQRNAEKTRMQFPGFDLDVEMQDEKFRRLCAVNQGDTTAAYMACHWNEIMNHTIGNATRQAQIATANSIASGANRPAENAIANTAPSVTAQSFKGMSLDEIRAYAAEQRRKGRK